MKIAIIAAMDKEYELLKDFKTDNPFEELGVAKRGFGKGGVPIGEQQKHGRATVRSP